MGWRLLERGMRPSSLGPSRAASCEPRPELSVLEEASPEPSTSQFSPPRSLCPSPLFGSLLNSVEDGQHEDVGLAGLVVKVRLCHSRCGSSSAVLELLLEHGAGC